MTPPLGIIEGYFGTPWAWSARTSTMQALAGHGYGFYFYAPKADAYLRRKWQDIPPPAHTADIRNFAAACKSAGVRFGMGLSPYDAFRNFDAAARAGLIAKIKYLNSLEIDDLVILFDDMHGDIPDLAARQIEIIEVAAAVTTATRITMCPSYYSDDVVLDAVFGARPADYLATLGAGLDRAINIFWTGPEVCTREYSVAHLQRVRQLLQRAPLLWDNYPVNDGARMSQVLHLRGVTGRPAAISAYIAGHAINPALQPALTCVPAITLAMSYAQGDAYDYAQAFLQAATQHLGAELATMLQRDLLALHDTGRDRLASRADRLRARYSDIDHPAAREIIAWLDGAYTIDDAAVQTQ